MSPASVDGAPSGNSESTASLAADFSAVMRDPCMEPDTSNTKATSSFPIPYVHAEWIPKSTSFTPATAPSVVCCVQTESETNVVESIETSGSVQVTKLPSRPLTLSKYF